ncbi:aspartate/glutamate racemase family protein [Caenimonas aquaedulcis]
MFPPDPARRLGILMLSTRFPRPPGDVGHPGSWRGDTEFRVVEGAGPRDAVRDAAGLREGPVLAAFSAAARELEANGVGAITTSCGFLVLLQEALQDAVKVPVVTSSLLLLPALLAREPQVGVLTIDARHLGDAHLRQAGVPPGQLADVMVEGVDPGGEFARAILGNDAAMDLARAGRDVVAAARALRGRAPRLRTVVLECTNMPPYAQAIRDATGFEVLSLADVPALKSWAAEPMIRG